MKEKEIVQEGIYEYIVDNHNQAQGQLCPVCKAIIGILPGSVDAICHNCGYKDPCCE